MRDDFPESVKRLLAARVAYRCSRPDCRAPTIGPQLDPAGTINIGAAAHITAASASGPRFDPTITNATRASADNGIWLCQTCAKLIDSDIQRYTVEVLRQWKALAEENALAELGKAQARVFREKVGLQFDTFLPRFPGIGSIGKTRRRLRVFIAYSTEDSDRARRIAVFLRHIGVDPWLDQERVPPGTEWRTEISNALQSADAVIILFSQSTAKRHGYVHHEIREALDIALALPNDALFVLPIRFDDGAVPAAFATWHSVDWTESSAPLDVFWALRYRARQLGLEPPSTIPIAG